MGGVPSVPKDPNRTLEVINAGMYRVRHDRPALLKALREATRGFVGISDSPGNSFIAELLELYTDAKVVCVTRDSERWWTSMELVVKHTSPAWLVGSWRRCPGGGTWDTSLRS